MTRLRKRGTRLKERPSLADYIKTRCLKALRTAMADVMADGGDIEAKIVERVVEGVLQDPEVLARVKSLEDLQGLAREMPEIMRELEAELAAPPSLLIPQRPDEMNIEPPALHAMLTEAAATVISTADDALAESTDANDPPTQNELAAWISAGNCPPETWAAVAERLAVLWDLDPGKVRVNGWAFGGLVTWRDGVEFHAPAAELLATAKRKKVPNPLYPLVNAWLERESAAYTSRHVQVVQTATGRYTKTPGLLATTSGQLEIVQVDGEPFAGRQPLMPKEGRTKAYRPAQPTQGELIAGPATIDGVPAGDLLLVGLDQWDLEEDERTTLRHDIIHLGRAAYALTGRATIPEDVGARWLTGQEHATETAKRRWWDTLAAMRWLTVRVNPKTHRWIGMFDVDPRTSGAVWIGPPAWWRESRAESGPRSWRLSGGLWRPPLIGDAPTQGTKTGYWGTLARTVDGIEAALTWGPTAGRGQGGRLPDYLKPVRKGGRGPEVFIPWRNVLRLAGERAPDDDASSTLRVRYKRRIEALRAAGLVVQDSQGAAPAGDTVEIVRVVDGRGGGRVSGIFVRATARFVEAYRLGQDSKALGATAVQPSVPAGRHRKTATLNGKDRNIERQRPQH